MISRVSIRNFKSLRDFHIGLERLTVFVGPNASGKSSILQGLDVLCRAFRSQDAAIEAEFSQVVSRGSKDPVELAAESGGMWYRYRSRVPSTQASQPNRNSPWAGDGRAVAPDLSSNDWRQWTPALNDSTSLPLSVLLRMEASKLVLPNPASPDATVIAPDGTGLHSALASMALNDPDSWQQLQANLRRIIPTIRRLRHTKTVLHHPASLLFDTVGADSLPASQVSEGTLLVLGLLAALHASSRPSLVLLDDMDRGLHPRAQRELVLLLRGLLETNPDLQIVATTHSPYMLDSMGPNEVCITFLRDDGTTVCAPLASHPKFKKWKDEMSAGELWSLFGEKWLVEQEAAS